MANLALYPPIVDSYSPAFIAGENAICRVYFSLSNFNSVNDFSSVQATVVRQDSGLSVVDDKKDSNGHYRKTGIILNLAFTEVSEKENLYYVDILNSDLKSVSKSYSGWIPGWIYKIQLRLSSVDYSGDGSDQSSWLNLHGSDFSEWSTVCVTKAIGPEEITIYNFDITDPENISYLTALNFYGHYQNEDTSELLSTYRVKTELEDSGVLQAKDDENSLQYFSYTFKKDYQYNIPYTVVFTYETINKYTNTYTMTFILESSEQPFDDVKVLTYEEDTTIMGDITNPVKEEDDGGILLKLYSENDIPYIGTICVRRTDSKSDYSEWSDVKFINLKSQSVNTVPAFYDLTIESGIYYKYATQFISTDDIRSDMNRNETTSMRNFEYSFLLGEDSRQLRLTFNNEMNSYKINVSEGKIDTIGGKFSYFGRNGDTYYKSFPITGLISFNMDENHLFTTKSELLGSSNISKYNNYNRQHGITTYDYIYEKAFRDKVLEFLYDGKYKLFKSSTEGNVIVRLMDINCTPNRSVNRLIYSFTANAYEADEPTMDNYLKYGFYKLDKHDRDEFDDVTIEYGRVSYTVAPGTDLITLLNDEFSTSVTVGDVTYAKRVIGISNVILSFRSQKIPFVVKGKTLLGHPVMYNNNFVGIREDTYGFSDYLVFKPYKDTLTVQGATGYQDEIIVDIYCAYDTVTETYVQNTQTAPYARTYSKITGQVDDTFNADEDIYQIIYDIYTSTLSAGKVEKELYTINKVIIEAPEYAVFSINNEEITINATGIYVTPYSNDINYDDITYLGMMNPSTGVIDSISAAGVVTFQGVVLTKNYK